MAAFNIATYDSDFLDEESQQRYPRSAYPSPPGYVPTALKESPPKGFDDRTMPNAPPTDGHRSHMGVYQDWWAGGLFTLHFIAVECIAIWLGVKGFADKDLQTQVTDPGGVGGYQDCKIKYWLPQLMAAAGVGLVFGWLYLLLMKMMPRIMITVSLWWGAFVYVFLGIVSLLTMDREKYTVIIFFIILAIAHIIYAVAARPRIPFAGDMLSQAVTVVNRFPSTVWVSYGMLLFSLEWISVWTLGFVGVMTLTSSVVVVFLLLLSFYWTMEVIRNIIHVTTAGTVAAYYFQGLNMPPNVTGRAFWRAATTSFGSICLGSFIAAFIQSFRGVALSLSKRRSLDLSSIGDCLLCFLEVLIRFFNKWAYVQVAVYGKSFCGAARDTWDLLQNQGVHLLINDDLTNGVIFMGCLFGGLLSASVAGVWTYVYHEESVGGVTIISFFIGLYMTKMTLSVIESSVSTYYVCYAEDPAALKRSDPIFFEKLRTRMVELQI